MHEWVLWALAAASALHVVEEHALGWQGWASNTFGEIFGIHPTWADFWATNMALIVFAVAAASVGWEAPAFSLGLPALCIINALLFHLLPTIQARRPNPGFFTAVLLYLPISAWCYDAAIKDDVLSAGVVIGSVAIGAAMMAAAIGILLLGKRFGYADEPSGRSGT